MTTHTPAEVPRPLDAIMLSVGDGHWLYVEEVGTRGAVPALFLHGGPGSGGSTRHRHLFDPERFHAVLFDQRGAGRSHPYLSTHANTTQHLVADIERIREHFGFESMLVVGGSWGSTLALSYAETHPERVSGLVLRAVFLGTDAEVDWAFRRAPSQLRPDLYENFVAALPEAERADPLKSYVARLTRAAIPRAAIRPRANGLGSSGRFRSSRPPRACCRTRFPPRDAFRRRRSSKPITSPTTSSCDRTRCWTAPLVSAPFRA